MTCVPVKDVFPTARRESKLPATPIGDKRRLSEDGWMVFFVSAFISICIQAKVYPRTDGNSRQAADYSVHAGPQPPKNNSNQENH